MTGQAVVTARVFDHQPVDWSQHICRTGGITTLTSWLTAFVTLWMALVRGNTGAVYLVCSRSNAGFFRDIPALILAVSSVPVVVHAHGSDIAGLLKDRWISPLARVLYRRCELIVPSEHLVPLLEDVQLRKLHVCENFSSVDGDTTPNEARSRRKPLHVLWNSNIMSSKGFFELAEAVRQANEAEAEILLTSIGGPVADVEMARDEIEERIAALHRFSWFQYLGPVSPKRAAALVSDSDVVALPSRYITECQPLAIIDAMCAGKHVIVSDTPALRATIGDYPAKLVSSCSVEDIRNALDELVAPATGAFAAGVMIEAAAAARRRFSVRRFDRQMSEILSAGSKHQSLA